MGEFRTNLQELIGSNDKLVIVIDELDRCRPDYALATLEIIKHFFDLPNIVFVLGINQAEMSNIVKSRYGLDVDTRGYLQKFITLNAHLPQSERTPNGNRANCLKYLTLAGQKMDLDDKFLEIVSRYIGLIQDKHEVTLRNVQKILSQMAIVPINSEKKFSDLYVGWQEVISALVVMKIMNEDLYLKSLNNNIVMNDLREWLGLPSIIEQDSHSYDMFVADLVFGTCLEPERFKGDPQGNSVWGGFGLHQPETKISSIAMDYLEMTEFT